MTNSQSTNDHGNDVSGEDSKQQKNILNTKQSKAAECMSKF